MRRNALGVAPWILAVVAGSASAQIAYVNFETPQVSPVALTPDGSRLLVVNTADSRLEIFDATGPAPVRIASVPVGLDPVSVRARTNNEAWVVNHISDSVSVIDLSSARVVRTMSVADGPGDVVFAGSPQRAFVSCSKANSVMVFDPASPATAPTTIAIAADEPRALAVSPDGSRVYAAVYFSGNKSTILPANAVSNPSGPYAGRNPPPNSGNAFDPPISPALPTPPTVALIVKQDPSGVWVDDNIGNWSSFVTWTLADRDVAIIDAGNPAAPVTYAGGLMNINAGIAVRPDGVVTTVGTDGINEVRFEDNVNGVFVRAELASFSPASPVASRLVTDLNPHLDYTSPSAPPAVRAQSLGDPRAIVWNAAGTLAYVSGRGSGSVAVFDSAGARVAMIPVGKGPTGLALAGSRLFVLNHFDASISVIDTVSNTETARVPFYDPTPTSIKDGRPLLFDTHLTSGLGQASCASCHVDARSDGLAWDLGSPQGTTKTVNQPCRQGPNGCAPWHPMKGPMVTQSLQGIVGQGAMHWRGDKENVAAFNVAYESLQGSTQRSTAEMQRLTDYIATIVYPPNPNRDISTGALRTALAVSNGTGNPQTGQTLFVNTPRFGPPGPGGLTCVACHTLPTGTDQRIDFPGPPAANQSLKDVGLRGQEEKVGFNRAQPNSIRGFGYNHDGTGDTLFALFGAPPFNFPNTAAGQQERRDMEAFLLSLTNDTHAAVGRQITLNGANNANAPVIAALDQFKLLADSNQVGLIVKGVQSGEARGFLYTGSNVYQSDRAGEAVNDATLRASAVAGSELTWTVVPRGTERRAAIDRDGDGALDRDEIDAGYNPADPASSPLSPCPGDADGSRNISFADVTAVLANFGAAYPPGAAGTGDADRSGRVAFTDVTLVLANFGSVCP